MPNLLDVLRAQLAAVETAAIMAAPGGSKQTRLYRQASDIRLAIRTAEADQRDPALVAAMRSIKVGDTCFGAPR